MSWGFGGLASAIPSTEIQANSGKDLESIETEKLGFQALAGDRKVKLLSQSWLAGPPPSKTASLLAIAPARALLAAADPANLFLYDTDAIRAAFSRDGPANVDDLTPKAQFEIPRISHLTFTSNEQAIIVAAESNGGLAIYDVNKIAPGVTADAQISTDGVAVRHMLPNPNKDFSHLVAVVLENGNLVMANLKSQELVQSKGGSTVYRDNVSCASWSKMGKQIVVGLADGSAVQLDTQGEQKERIPRPPNVEGEFHVNTISWLENLDFLTVHTAVATPQNPMDIDGIYHIVHRDKETKVCSFHRFAVAPCVVIDDQLPANFFIQRIRDWQPDLDDTLIVACSASTDVGVFTRSKLALSADLPADQITHLYTTTGLPDTRRPALPLATDGAADTFPIGVALDMSSQQTVAKPVPNDETLDASANPLPQYCILNQVGYLSAWWYVYNEAVQKAIPAPGLMAREQQASNNPQPNSTTEQSAVSASPFGQLKQAATTTQSSSPFSTLGKPTPPAFGQPSAPTSGFGSSTTFGQLNGPAPTFGQPSASQSPFGQQTSSTFGKPSFGGSSTLGQSSSPWGTGATAGGSSTQGQPSFGKPSFGAASQLGTSTGQSAFGQLSGMGMNKPSPWATLGTTSTASPFASASPFGASTGQASPFAAIAKSDGKDAASGSPFAGFASKQNEKSPFASFGSQKDNLSPFAASSKPGLPNETSFGSTVTLDSKTTSSFGSGSTFAASPFGKPQTAKEEAMNDETPREEKSQSSALKGLSSFKLGSTFRPDESNKNDLPISQGVSNSLFGTGFGAALGAAASEPTVPAIKDEPDDTEAALENIPAVSPSALKSTTTGEARLPPDFLTPRSSKTVSFQDDAPLPPDFTTSSAKPVGEDAPLPPDFTVPKSTIAAPADAPLPPDFLSVKSEVSVDQANISLPTNDASESDLDDGEDDGEEEGETDEDESDDNNNADQRADDQDEEDDDEEWDDEDDEDDDHDEVEDDDEDSRIIVNPTKLSAFEARLAPASPTKTNDADESTTPEALHKATFTPAGFPKAPLTFVPTRKVEQSPRSPSPVRAVTSPVRFEHSKGASTTGQRPVIGPASSQNRPDWSTPVQRPVQPLTLEELEDAESLQRHKILTAPIEPCIEIAEFIAHQDYAGDVEKDDLPKQVERVYRDINGMIDTLGFNARNLQCFVAGHEQTRLQRLDQIHDQTTKITLGDLSSLDRIQDKLTEDLQAGRLTDVSEKISDLAEQDEQVARSTAAAFELRKQLALRTDPEKKAQQQAQPLPQAWAAQQIELRQSLQNVHKLMAEVEDSISVLRADLASASVSAAATSMTVPTVETVTKTIAKMTAMIEKKSGDIDVLERQIRRLPGGLQSLDLPTDEGDALAESLAASRISNGSFSTPRKGRTNGTPLGMSAMLGSRFQTPASGRSSVLFDPSASLLGRSTASFSGSTRRKMSDVTTEEVEAWNRKVARRRDVLSALREQLKQAGDRTVRYGQTK